MTTKSLQKKEVTFTEYRIKEIRQGFQKIKVPSFYRTQRVKMGSYTTRCQLRDIFKKLGGNPSKYEISIFWYILGSVPINFVMSSFCM